MSKKRGVTLETRVIVPEAAPHPHWKHGRHVEHDSRSWDYRVKTYYNRCPWWPAPLPTPIPPKPIPTQTVLWVPSIGPLDQGDLGSCVGNCTANLVATSGNGHTPEVQNEQDAVDWYSLCTNLDNIDGQYPPTDTGSSTLGAMKALQSEGYIKGYNNCFSVDDIIAALQKDPVAGGFNWHQDMYYPDADGFVQPTGPVVGGHEFMIYGWDAEDQYFTARNSWGDSWGLGGDFRISRDTMTTLMSEDGDVAVPVWVK